MPMGGKIVSQVPPVWLTSQEEIVFHSRAISAVSK